MKIYTNLLFVSMVFSLGVACSSDTSEGAGDAGSMNDTLGSSDMKNSDVSIPDASVPDEEDIFTKTDPCTFDLSNLTPGQTLTIDCVLDLEESTNVLPADVSFDFEGGDIINGSLSFSGGYIAGELLNHTLTIEGDAVLKEPILKFFPSRWAMTQGQTTVDLAYENTKMLEDVINLVKRLEGNALHIDKLDAYFDVTQIMPPRMMVFRPTDEAINIPSDFHLAMTDRSHLRVFPARERKAGSLFAIVDTDNTHVSGGHLHGDREEGGYNEGNNHEGVHLMMIVSGRNTLFEGTHMVEGSKGSLNIQSLGFRANPEYNGSKDVVVRNCIFEDSRRMAISLTDGTDINILDNTFIRTGLDMANSDGGEVRYSINIEATRIRDDDGNLIEREKATDILIKGNTEYGSAGAITVHIGQNVTIEDNDFGSKVSWTYTNGTRIINNRFVATPESAEGWAIFGGGDGDTVFGNEIAGNTITGYALGIAMSTFDLDVHDNIIDGKVGIQFGKATKIKIRDNTIVAENQGLTATNSYADKIDIRGNKITANSTHFTIHNFNENPEHNAFEILVEDNDFVNSSTKGSISKAFGVTVKNNRVAGGLQVGSSSRVTLEKNTISPAMNDGIRLYDANINIVVKDNVIKDPAGERYKCINNNSDTPEEVTLSGNICN